MDGLMQVFADISLGAATAISLHNLMWCFLGVLIGIFTGILPGIGAITAISLLLPLTFQLAPASALIMLAGIWYGSTFGGSITAILLNIPGTPANAVTCLDGHAMAKQGRASEALIIAIMSSFAGGSFGILMMMLFTGSIAKLALGFSSVEYFALIVLGLVAATAVSHESALKGLVSVVLGIMAGTVGTDVYSGTMRFTFGYIELAEGISLVALAMGLFGISEIICSLGMRGRSLDQSSVNLSRFKLPRAEIRRLGFPVLRASSIGSFLGALPGTGPAIAAFLSYAVETRLTKDRSRFGRGAPEGVAAAESANNAADMTAFIPTLSLGIPGSPTMALMLGALIINGIAPGPMLMRTEPDLFWGLVVSFWIGSLMLLALSIPLIRVWVRLLSVPYRILVPAIIMFICIGTYSVHNTSFDVWLIVLLGLAGYLLRQFGYPPAPLLLGFVLGPMLEDHFRRSMLLSRGDFMTFLERPVSAGILLLTLAILIWGLMSGSRDRKRLREAKSKSLG